MQAKGVGMRARGDATMTPRSIARALRKQARGWTTGVQTEERSGMKRAEHLNFVVGVCQQAARAKVTIRPRRAGMHGLAESRHGTLGTGNKVKTAGRRGPPSEIATSRRKGGTKGLWIRFS